MEITPNILNDAKDFIRLHGAVTFVELEQFAAGQGIEVRGDFDIAVSDLNIMMWPSVSEDFVALVEALRPLTEFRTCSILSYLFDGGMVRLPIAKRVPKNGYRKPHWAPVELRMKRSR